MTETLRFLWLLVLKFGGKNWQSYLIHSLSWQKGHTLQTLMMSLITLQYIVCWERRVSSIQNSHCRISTISKLQGTHAQMGGGIFISSLESAKAAEATGTYWYRSKKPIPISHPFVDGGYLSNKKWPLIEECALITVTLTGQL